MNNDLNKPSVGVPNSDRSKFLILLATYNGARFLDEQVKSLHEQNVQHIDIIVSDDGSVDGTMECLKEWKKKWHKGSFQIAKGPGRGFASNFTNLMKLTNTDPDYVAFCDQDDIWKSNKLSIAAARLAHLSDRELGLYCGRTELISDRATFLGYSRVMRRDPSFENALVQSIAGANTMVLNRAGFNLVREASLQSSYISHDWWSYLLVSGAGGLVIYDAEPYVYYRQHSDSLVGSNRGLLSGFQRLHLGARGRMRYWMNVNLKGLEGVLHLLTTSNAETVSELIVKRQSGRLPYLRYMIARGIARQSISGDIKLYAAALLGRL